LNNYNKLKLVVLIGGILLLIKKLNDEIIDLWSFNKSLAGDIYGNFDILAKEQNKNNDRWSNLDSFILGIIDEKKEADEPASTERRPSSCRGIKKENKRNSSKKDPIKERKSIPKKGIK